MKGCRVTAKMAGMESTAKIRSVVSTIKRTSAKGVSAAELSYVKPSPIDCRNLTRGNVAGRGASAHLTESGRALMRLYTFPD